MSIWHISHKSACCYGDGDYVGHADRPRRAAVINYIADGVMSDTDEALLNGVPVIKKVS